MDFNEYFQAAPVSCIIFAITIGCSIYAFQNSSFQRRWMLHPYTLVHKNKYSQVLTSGFIHADWMHLLFNMMSYYFFAISLENTIPLETRMILRVGPIGHLYFALIYLGSMVFGDFSTILNQKDNPGYYSLGASGAISGLIFSYILFEPTSRIRIFMFPSMPAPVFAILFVVFSIYAARSRNTNINHDAHLWGGLFGFALTVPLFPGILQTFLTAIKHIF